MSNTQEMFRNRRVCDVHSEWSPSADSLVASMMRVSISEESVTDIGYFPGSGNFSRLGMSRSSQATTDLSALLSTQQASPIPQSKDVNDLHDSWGYFVDSA